jgi:hypothetical protein
MRRCGVKYAIVLLIAFVVQQAPWRLMVLAGETLVVHPGLTRVKDGVDKYWDCLNLEHRLMRDAYSVTYAPGAVVSLVGNMGESLYGLTDPQARFIMIADELRWNERLAVLAHEGGHTLEPGGLSMSQGEAFAESVAMLVSHDGFREHARYLSSIRLTAIVTMIAYWPEIYRAADHLEN